MRGLFIFAIVLSLLISFTSAEIVITQQPNTLYNFGDLISVPVIITSPTDISGAVEMNLICNGIETNFYKNGIKLPAGVEKMIDAGVILDSQNIGNVSSFCTIKAILNSDYALTNEFKVSNIIYVQLLTEKKEFNPGENLAIDGKATKEDGGIIDGFIDLIFVSTNISEGTIYQNTIKNGFFSVNFIIPKETKAGNYLLKLNAYDKDINGKIMNRGYADYNIRVNQIPTSLEILFEEQEVEPGTSMKVKAILHDQSGEKIDSSAVISVKDAFGNLLKQEEIPTDEFLELQIAYNEPPGEWAVIATSNAITNDMDFEIKEKETADVKIVNSTVLIKNIGNVPYNESLVVKIGEESFHLAVYLEMDESKKYSLRAPDGEYMIEIIGGGETQASETVALTGKIIGVKEASSFTFAKYYFAWIFVILVLGFVLIIVFKKGYQGSFVGYLPRFRSLRKDIKVEKETPKLKKVKKDLMLGSKNKAELSLSLKGEKQGASLIFLKIKNSEEIKRYEGAEQILQEIINLAEESKAIPYLSEGYDNMLFILTPAITKTFKNEKTAIGIANGIKDIFDRHNKMAKQKIDFGISLNYGDIVVMKDGPLLKFMSFGNLINALKKIASLSKNEILFSENMRNKTLPGVNLEKQIRKGIGVYVLKEKKVKDDTKKFISDFVRRLEKRD